MQYRIVHAEAADRESGEDYCYLIFDGGDLIAKYWHDFRGDAHGIVFTNGLKETAPVGSVAEFLQGGGPEPLTLSKRAQAFLKNQMDQNPPA